METTLEVLTTRRSRRETHRCGGVRSSGCRSTYCGATDGQGSLTCRDCRGMAALPRASRSAMLLVAEAFVPNGYCRAFPASRRWMAMQGYNRLIAPDRVDPDIRLAHCWVHARRKLVEITHHGTAPTAEEGVKRIGDLYRIEAELRGFDADARLARRQERSGPLVADMQSWLVHHRPVSRRSPLSARPWPTSPNTGMA